MNGAQTTAWASAASRAARARGASIAPGAEPTQTLQALHAFPGAHAIQGLQGTPAPHRAARLARGRIVHLAPYLDEATLVQLAGVTSALAREGRPQSLMFIDEPRRRGGLVRLDSTVGAVPVPPQRNPLAQWQALSDAFAMLVDHTAPASVHLYGDTAAVLGGRVLRRLDSRLHAVHAPGPLGPARLLHALRPLALLARLLGHDTQERHPPRRIGSAAAHESPARALTRLALTVVEGPVDATYFLAMPSAARHARIVSASRSRDAVAVAAFDQLAVLLGGDGLGLRFDWLGPLDKVAQERFRAAQVGMLDPNDDAARANDLASAWMYVALSAEPGFPQCLAEAMATGLPCVAMDTAAHRSLVQQGETGYLCQDMGEVVARIAQLADTPGLRERMGATGRALARQRFGEAHFENTLIAA